jgi:hypothetical protein
LEGPLDAQDVTYLTLTKPSSREIVKAFLETIESCRTPHRQYLGISQISVGETMIYVQQPPVASVKASGRPAHIKSPKSSVDDGARTTPITMTLKSGATEFKPTEPQPSSLLEALIQSDLQHDSESIGSSITSSSKVTSNPEVAVADPKHANMHTRAPTNPAASTSKFDQPHVELSASPYKRLITTTKYLYKDAKPPFVYPGEPEWKIPMPVAMKKKVTRQVHSEWKTVSDMLGINLTPCGLDGRQSTGVYIKYPLPKRGAALPLDQKKEAFVRSKRYRAWYFLHDYLRHSSEDRKMWDPVEFAIWWLGEEADYYRAATKGLQHLTAEAIANIPGDNAIGTTDNVPSSNAEEISEFLKQARDQFEEAFENAGGPNVMSLYRTRMKEWKDDLVKVVMAYNDGLIVHGKAIDHVHDTITRPLLLDDAFSHNFLELVDFCYRFCAHLEGLTDMNCAKGEHLMKWKKATQEKARSNEAKYNARYQNIQESELTVRPGQTAAVKTGNLTGKKRLAFTDTLVSAPKQETTILSSEISEPETPVPVSVPLNAEPAVPTSKSHPGLDDLVKISKWDATISEEREDASKNQQPEGWTELCIVQ